ncbi:uncharacterized protein involved in oxidation of intracellular sulfur [Rhodoblastus acidophilus]|uniref:DsrE/DsrF/TusD sulfur relay family protein n=1 Tax=Rhodoblastus acidophilus TaxID=1074 RepID=UPI0022256752|nr:DsrE family protein [Rhodoblastus acidophilus]MCW2285421.1 uncharacterized protein involved in oxidation of intracellular sulfur [Rhodoblastus acidophilus]MCW2334330.1 uncharacterized protein involved in oxidation of intracellular sulfur [Rhodoblastus acidophilus]
MTTLFIIADTPYGGQRAWNGLRLAAALAPTAPIRVFLLGDGVLCAQAGLMPAQPEFCPQDLLQAIAATDAPILACGTCLDARGLTASSLIPEVQRGVMTQLAEWTASSTKVLTF